MKISIYCNDGSPLGVIPSRIAKEGVGGAELSMMTWAAIMGSQGHEVTIYNNPEAVGEHADPTYRATLPGNIPVMYRNQADFRPQDEVDIFIIYRSPNPHVTSTNAKLKIHWSTDQQTMGDYQRDIVPYVDQIVCISPFHESYYRERYGGEGKIRWIDLGVRTWEYNQEPIERNPYQFIFCSVPQRGLMGVHKIWPKIKERYPEAELVITSDYRLWGAHTPGNEQERAAFMGMDGVNFLGKVPRKDLATLQRQSAFQLYPCTYDELFCISTAECQVSGAIPITSNLGALQTTNQGGVLIVGDTSKNPALLSKYVEAVFYLMGQGLDQIDQDRSIMISDARRRFDWEFIAREWVDMFNDLADRKGVELS